MNVVTRGIRNAFRNSVRTVSIVVILGLGLGLSLAMLVAHQAVTDKIASVKASVGNTVTIQPAGYSGQSQVNNALTTTQLNAVKALPHVTSLVEELQDRLPTTGSSAPSFGRFQASSSGSTTSLTSPVQINLNGNGPGGGRRFFINGGGGLPSNFSPPVSFLGTTDPSRVNNTTVTVTSGKFIDGSSSSDNAMISQSMASKNNLKVGSTFTAYNTSLTVSGIFIPSNNNQGVNNTVVLSLPAEESLSGQSGTVTNAVATVDSLDNLSSVTSAIGTKLGTSADVTSSVDQANAAVQPLNSVKSVSLYSLIGAVIAAAVILLMIMVMIVRERRREIGVIKAIGASNLKVMWQFMSEAVTLTLLAAVIGIILGVLAGGPVTHALVSNSTNSGTPGSFSSNGPRPQFRSFRVSHGFFGGIGNNFSAIHAAAGWDILLYGLGAALLIAITASALSSFFIAKIRPAEVMRVE